MEEDEKEGQEEGSSRAGAQGPGLRYSLFSQNEDLIDKLKLLNYEEEYVSSSSSHRPISRHYFVESSNIGEQFFLFTTLCGWLIQKAINPNFPMPQEFDDPNATISNVLSELRNHQVPVDFPPNKLKSGSGEQCLYVLDQLCDLALIAETFAWNRAQPVAEDDEEIDIGADEAEITAEEFNEEEDIAIAEDDDNGILMDLQSAPIPGLDKTEQNEQPLESILHSETDANSWKREVERMTPQLKITIRQDAKDWRMHLEQMQTYRSSIGDLMNTTWPPLDSMSKELEKNLERIAIREKHLNSQLEGLLNQLRSVRDKMAESKEKYKEASGGIMERTQTLQRVSDEIEQIKEQIDEQGQRNSDGGELFCAPMVRIKQALVKLESDITTMDVQIGVIEQSLLQSQLKDRIAYSTDAYAQF
uniref:Intraflagellar transport protein 57 homolog n=1 Tax=Ascaris lumbricoides TaxID=6252 RepID=A0A9J2PB62_ASCLU